MEKTIVTQVFALLFSSLVFNIKIALKNINICQSHIKNVCCENIAGLCTDEHDANDNKNNSNIYCIIQYFLIWTNISTSSTNQKERSNVFTENKMYKTTEKSFQKIAKI